MAGAIVIPIGRRCAWGRRRGSGICNTTVPHAGHCAGAQGGRLLCAAPLDLLVSSEGAKKVVSEGELEGKKNNIVRTLTDFGIQIQSIKATVGATVTLYEIVP